MGISQIFTNMCLRALYKTRRAIQTTTVVLVVGAAPVVAQGQSSDEINAESAAQTSQIPDAPAGLFKFQPVDTNSPRETLNSFIRLTWILESALLRYQAAQNRDNFNRIATLGPRFSQLLDLSEVPKASRREVGENTIAYLLDIIGRLDLPPLEEVPDETAFEDEQAPAKWRIPGTPIRIVQVKEGPREGEFLFSGRSVELAPWFYQRIQHRPLRSTLGIESWNSVFPQFHGPLIPAGLVTILPDSLKRVWLGTPIWKIIAVVILALAATLLLIFWHRWINRFGHEKNITLTLYRLLSPLAIIAVTLALRPFFAVEIDLSGYFAQLVDSATTLVIYLAAVWAFWLLVITVSEWIILSPKLPEGSLDANLVRLTARVVGFVGVVVILAYGAQDLGLPVLGLLAGLGVGGLAVALAVRPTLENLIGGAILYIDRPIRVGDFCSFGDQTGTIEAIGVRSTKVRALDRTLVTVPNSALADMQLINWAKCDRMLITATIGLRYETDSDQLRYVLVKFREMLHAHPKIDRDTVRVRFAGYGASSLDIGIRVYALTREWNEFHAIREDIFLRMKDIVEQSGSGFAFPSQTLYMGRDDGLDSERGEAAVKEVQSWRRDGRLPFPKFTDEKIDQLADTLDYPPSGSPHAGRPEAEAHEIAEPLSKDEESEDKDKEEPAKYDRK